jgi:hypothetical protein
MIFQQWAAIIKHISRLFLVTINEQCVSSRWRYTLEQCVYLNDTCMKFGSARKYRRKFRCKFRDEIVPSRQRIHNVVNRLRSTGLLIDKTQKYKRRVLTEEKLDDIGARLEHTPRKSLKRLAQEIGVSNFSARKATQFRKLRPYKTTVIHALQSRDPANRVHFCCWFLQSVIEGEIYPQLIFSSDEARFRLQGYINTQNNRYWNSQNPHLTHEVPLHAVKVGVWCAVSARRICGGLYF